MYRTDIELLEQNGWDVMCECPFEIQHENGSFATLNAARIVLDSLKPDVELIEFVRMVSLIKDSYEAKLISGDTLITKIVEVVDGYKNDDCD